MSAVGLKLAMREIAMTEPQVTKVPSRIHQDVEGIPYIMISTENSGKRRNIGSGWLGTLAALSVVNIHVRFMNAVL